MRLPRRRTRRHGCSTVPPVETEYWNGEAGRAWAEGAPMMDRILLPFAETLLDAAGLPEDGVLVDVGCGCGATTLLAADRHPRLTAVGVDVSRPMLAVARQRAQARGNVTFVESDAARGALEAGPADRIVSRFGVMFFPDPTAAFGNLRAWLRPGGTFTAIVWNPIADNPWLRDMVNIVGRHTPLEWEPGDGPGPFALGDAAKTAVMLQSAGWTEVEQQDLDLPMRVEGSIEEVVDFCLHRGPVATALVDATEEARAKVLHDLDAWVRQRHDGAGASLEASTRCVRAVAP